MKKWDEPDQIRLAFFVTKKKKKKKKMIKTFLKGQCGSNRFVPN